jgi:starch synthase (maltosyl-transferring)
VIAELIYNSESGRSWLSFNECEQVVMMKPKNSTIIIENVYPELDSGRYPVKRIAGETFNVSADIFKEGHDVLAAVLKYRRKKDATWHEAPMKEGDNDRWYGMFTPGENARYIYTIEAYTDIFRSWKHNFVKKAETGEDISSELLEGQRIIDETVGRASGSDGKKLSTFLQDLRVAGDNTEAVRIVSSEQLGHIMARYPDKSDAVLYDRELEVVVNRQLAGFAAWYEMFHRSQGSVPGKSATFADCERRLKEIKDMGFDVIYLPPVHPIGITNRKGRNNKEQAGAGDPGSPWAIGNETGGHKSINPDLGTLDDFKQFVEAARALDIEIALDLAIQCSADHPYLKEHPEWFFKRPDGSIRYAENPPKKYQDIYPLDFYCEQNEALWEELKSIVLFWIECGVKIFRVDNPHTKPFQFWEWLIADIQETYPDVIFLAEAFTRPKVLNFLAKAGYTQSYTYFTWRNFKEELIEYMTELTRSGIAEYLQGNLFTNTPDILPPILQRGGTPAFKMRLVLAATLSPVYGIYNGFELCENRAIPGTEEYLNSEKYEYKVWDWDRPGNIKNYIARINKIRKENAALQGNRNLRFYDSDDENILFYGKMAATKDNLIFVVVNLDPFQTHESIIRIPVKEFGISLHEKYMVDELINGTTYLWTGETQKITLDPAIEPAMVLRISRWAYKDYDTPCF